MPPLAHNGRYWRTEIHERALRDAGRFFIPRQTFDEVVRRFHALGDEQTHHRSQDADVVQIARPLAAPWTDSVFRVKWYDDDLSALRVFYVVFRDEPAGTRGTLWLVGVTVRSSVTYTTELDRILADLL